MSNLNDLRKALNNMKELDEKSYKDLVAGFGKGTVKKVIEELFAKDDSNYDKFSYYVNEIAIADIEKEDEADTVLDFNGALLNDSVRQYYKEISQFSLMTFEEERELATKIKNNKQELEENLCLLSKVTDGEIKLKIDKYIKKLRSRDKRLADEFINRNLRLVPSIAKKYKVETVDMLDLIQSGNEGLMKAVERYDVDRGFKFSTYATWWIRQAITRELANHSRTIRIPVHTVEKMNKINRYRKEFLLSNGRYPTVIELSKLSGFSEICCEETLKAIENSALASLDKTLNGMEDDTTLGDFVKDEGISVEDIAFNEDLRTTLLSLLDELSPREKKVLMERNGFNDENHVCTLEEVGNMLGVTRERIRQIEGKALRKLKNPTRSRKISDYKYN